MANFQGMPAFPIAIFPPRLNFFLEDLSTHKQVLTLYNVYNKVVQFRVLSTARSKYQVVEPEGIINPQRAADIVIRHKEVKPANCNVIDQFQLQVREYATGKLLGTREVQATLHSGVPVKEETVREDSSQHLSLSGRINPASSRDVPVRSGPNVFIVFVAIFCLAGLLWPSEEPPTNFWVDIFRKIKILCAYILGLSTVAILHP